MIDRINQISGVQPVQGQSSRPKGDSKGSDFAAALANASEKLKVSAHAQKRLDSSQVKLTDSDIQRIDGAVHRASTKGSNQSLIMLDDLALVVSVKNKTIITAVDEARRQEGIFTNIDSVVIA
jgi:flagellar operon protein